MNSCIAHFYAFCLWMSCPWSWGVWVLTPFPKGGRKIHDIQIRAKVVELSKLQISDMCALVVMPNVRRDASWSTRFVCGTGPRQIHMPYVIFLIVAANAKVQTRTAGERLKMVNICITKYVWQMNLENLKPNYHARAPRVHARGLDKNPPGVGRQSREFMREVSIRILRGSVDKSTHMVLMKR